MEPQLRDFQLIGDNMLFRYAEQILMIPRQKIKATVFIGLCISGVKTKDLLQKVKEELYPFPKKVILMVGTNDILQNTDSTSLRKHLHELVYYLRFKIKVQKLIIVTIPPVPRVVDKPYHWKTLKEYNEHIWTFHNGKDVIVIDAYPYFIKNNHSYNNPSPILSTNGKSFRGSGRGLNIRNIHFEESNNVQGCISKITTTYMDRKRSYLPAFVSLESEFYRNSQDNLNESHLGGSYSEEIELKYFQECIENKITRPDNIHLNEHGLLLIHKLILNAIDE